MRDIFSDAECVYCGVPVTPASKDHLRPVISRETGLPSGYCSDRWNLVACCKTCNSSKQNRSWEEFMNSKSAATPVARNVATVTEHELRKANLEKFAKLSTPQYWCPEQHPELVQLRDDILSSMMRHAQLIDTLQRRIGKGGVDPHTSAYEYLRDPGQDDQRCRDDAPLRHDSNGARTHKRWPTSEPQTAPHDSSVHRRDGGARVTCVEHESCPLTRSSSAPVICHDAAPFPTQHTGSLRSSTVVSDGDDEHYDAHKQNSYVTAAPSNGESTRQRFQSEVNRCRRSQVDTSNTCTDPRHVQQNGGSGVAGPRIIAVSRHFKQPASTGSQPARNAAPATTAPASQNIACFASTGACTRGGSGTATNVDKHSAAKNSNSNQSRDAYSPGCKDAKDTSAPTCRPKQTASGPSQASLIQQRCDGKPGRFGVSSRALDKGRKDYRLQNCRVCGLELISYNMSRHIRTMHSGTKPHSCRLCEYTTSRSDNLVAHMRVHASMSYRCSSCGFSGTSKRMLRGHKCGTRAHSPNGHNDANRERDTGDDDANSRTDTDDVDDGDDSDEGSNEGSDATLKRGQSRRTSGHTRPNQMCRTSRMSPRAVHRRRQTRLSDEGGNNSCTDGCVPHAFTTRKRTRSFTLKRTRSGHLYNNDYC
jgi:hypothetical protein